MSYIFFPFRLVSFRAHFFVYINYIVADVTSCCLTKNGGRWEFPALQLMANHDAAIDTFDVGQTTIVIDEQQELCFVGR